VSNDGVAKLSSFTHETCRLPDGHVEGVDAVRHRDDVVDATEGSEKFGNHTESRTVEALAGKSHAV
jgi:hypothetical protein